MPADMPKAGGDVEREDLDAETQRAIKALVYRLRNRGEADDEPFATEFMLALRARGWRPFHVKPVVNRGPRTGAGLAMLHEVKADIEARNAEKAEQERLERQQRPGSDEW